MLSNDVTPKSGFPQYTHVPFAHGLSFVQNMSSPNLLLIFYLFSSTHLFCIVPPNSCVAMVPNIIRKKENSMNTSSMVGSEFSNACTSFLILGIELMVLRGLRMRITRIAETLLVVITWLTQPMITTQKSS